MREEMDGREVGVGVGVGVVMWARMYRSSHLLVWMDERADFLKLTN
jgi:hypothetical protein